ncbi:hypothetical protein DUI87_15662 [Hirundo rustica rustica]|uniref:Uncharacterized protein n=1 Tax=Hirundo rustica rustica TaxID=333673 RepID=A0A3M0K1N1_HIRRU|nr:hypothetical protein DUI87_15662 [Hirundo rustica rustica]
MYGSSHTCTPPLKYQLVNIFPEPRSDATILAEASLTLNNVEGLLQLVKSLAINPSCENQSVSVVSPCKAGPGQLCPAGKNSGGPKQRVEWSGVEWSGVEWSGVEWSGVEWSGVQWSAVECSGVQWSAVEMLQLGSVETLADENIIQKAVNVSLSRALAIVDSE